jgi:outer membrane protein
MSIGGSGGSRIRPGTYAALAAASVLLVLPAAVSAREANHVVLGAGVAVTPAFQGADDYRTIPIPAIDIKQGWFFANLRNGVGITPIDGDVLTIGASAVFVQGYRRQDVPTGIHRLSDGVGARLFATVRNRGLIATGGVTKVVSGGTRGTTADFSISYPMPLSPRFALTPTLGTTWADRKYNDRYFGVTAAEAAAAGVAPFRAGAGFKDASAALTASYRLTDRVSLSATGIATALLGTVHDSAQIEHKTQPSGFLTATYRL